MPFGRKLLLAACALAAGLALSLAFAEAALRLWAAAQPAVLTMDRSPARWRVPPGRDYYGFRLNSGGYHDTEFQRERAPGVKRVVALGDSFAFGVAPYADNFLTRLEERLRGGGIAAEVYNLGVPATHTGDYLDLLQREGLTYRPDLVLVNVFLGNDLQERGRKLTELSGSLFIAWVKSLHQYFPKYWTALAGRDAYCDDCPSMTAEAYLALEQTRGRICRTDFAPLLEWAALAAGDLRRMQAACGRRGARLLVALAPDELQVDRDLQAAVFAGADPATIDVRRPNRELASRLTAAGIAVADLTPAFIADAANGRLYKPRDSHWNRRGNRLAAETLAPAVAAALR